MPGRSVRLAGLPGERSRRVMTRKPCRAQAPAAKGLRAGAALAYSGRWALCAAALCRPAMVPGAPDRGARCTWRAGRTGAGHGPALQPPPAAALLSGWQQPTVSLVCLQCISSQPMVHLVPSLHSKSESLTACPPSAICCTWEVGADDQQQSWPCRSAYRMQTAFRSRPRRPSRRTCARQSGCSSGTCRRTWMQVSFCCHSAS